MPLSILMRLSYIYIYIPVLCLSCPELQCLRQTCGEGSLVKGLPLETSCAGRSSPTCSLSLTLSPHLPLPQHQNCPVGMYYFTNAGLTQATYSVITSWFTVFYCQVSPTSNICSVNQDLHAERIPFPNYSPHIAQTRTSNNNLVHLLYTIVNNN